jgi:SAM-dependent methyltransferase
VAYDDRLRDKLKIQKIGPKLAHEARRAAAPYLSKRSWRIGQQFEGWPDDHLTYFVHPHNSTWRNERTVEIALARQFIENHGRGRGLEFGNVMAWYDLRGNWPVIDKYELAPNVHNVDVLDFRAGKPLDFIMSLSTLEHVGWDERPQDPGKALRALDHLLSMLAPDGVLFITAPMGHNPALDRAILDGLPADRQMTMVRDDDRWRPSDEVEFRPYVGKGRGADSVWVAEFRGTCRLGDRHRDCPADLDPEAGPAPG